MSHLPMRVVMVCLPQMVLDRQEYTLADELVRDVYRKPGS
jgi:hypothetical protein